MNKIISMDALIRYFEERANLCDSDVADECRIVADALRVANAYERDGILYVSEDDVVLRKDVINELHKCPAYTYDDKVGFINRQYAIAKVSLIPRYMPEKMKEE